MEYPVTLAQRLGGGGGFAAAVRSGPAGGGSRIASAGGGGGAGGSRFASIVSVLPALASNHFVNGVPTPSLATTTEWFPASTMISPAGGVVPCGLPSRVIVAPCTS